MKEKYIIGELELAIMLLQPEKLYAHVMKVRVGLEDSAVESHVIPCGVLVTSMASVSGPTSSLLFTWSEES